MTKLKIRLVNGLKKHIVVKNSKKKFNNTKIKLRYIYKTLKLSMNKIYKKLKIIVQMNFLFYKTNFIMRKKNESTCILILICFLLLLSSQIIHFSQINHLLLAMEQQLPQTILLENLVSNLPCLYLLRKNFVHN